MMMCAIIMRARGSSNYDQRSAISIDKINTSYREREMATKSQEQSGDKSSKSKKPADDSSDG